MDERSSVSTVNVAGSHEGMFEQINEKKDKCIVGSIG